MGTRSLDEFPPITGSKKGSFAEYTISNRLPAILNRIIEENNFSPSINRKLNELNDHILKDKVSCSIIEADDLSDWEKWLLPYVGKSWFELPFYFAETYFYRLLLDRINFFKDRIDPFEGQKQTDIDLNIGWIISILNDFQGFHNEYSSNAQLINNLLFTSLWGNKSDLSQLQLNRGNNVTIYKDKTIIDDAEEVIKLFGEQLNRIDIILDNSGVELFTDLFLAEKLISCGICNRVVLHAKAFPTFVSDATVPDIYHLINKLKTAENLYVKRICESINSQKKSGKIVIENHVFWNSPLHFYQFPRDLEKELARSDLLIFKGDANYRRIFGDRMLSPTINPAQLTYYLPAKSLAIRILKSEIITGMSNEALKKIRQLEHDWLVYGNYGIIQMLN